MPGVIGQQHLRATQQRPTNGHTLLLTAGQSLWPPGQQMTNAEHFNDAFLINNRRIAPGMMAPAKTQIGAHIHMRKKPRLLEDHPHMPPVGRDIDAPFAVKQSDAIQFNISFIGGHEAGDKFDDAGFARARRAI